MAEETPRLNKNGAPDPADAYERAKPENQSPGGRLDQAAARASEQPDRMRKAVGNRQENRQLNSDDVINASGNSIPASGQAAHGGEKSTTEATQEKDKGHTH